MNKMIDPQTLTLFMSVSLVLQVFALFLQYRMNSSCQGLGWWPLGSAVWALGFGVNYARSHPTFGPLAIIANNILFISGYAFIQTGVLRFFGKRQNGYQLHGICIVVTLIAIHSTLIDANLSVRRLTISAAMAFLSGLIGWTLLSCRTRQVYESATFLSTIFIGNAMFFTFRAITPFMQNDIADFSAPGDLQTLTYLVALVSSTLWTFGFIVMVNQSLHAESRESRDNLELIFNASPYAALITRLSDGAFVRINDAFCSMFGFAREEVLGKICDDMQIMNSAEDREQFSECLLLQHRCDNEELTFRRKNGSTLVGAISAKIIEQHGEGHILAVIRDITERKRSEELREEIERIVHHDLRTPASSAISVARFFSENQCLSAEERQMAALLELSGQRILDTLNLSLVLYKIETGNYRFEPKEFDAGIVMREIADALLLHPEHARKRVNIASLNQDGSELLCTISGDQNLFQLAMQNLLQNALEATPSGKTVEIYLHGSGGCTISIRNHGTVPEAIRPRFFEKYVTAGKARGTGIGTYSAKQMIEAQRGIITMRTSDKDNCTTLSIHLPG